jgi:hypothetical protein
MRRLQADGCPPVVMVAGPIKGGACDAKGDRGSAGLEPGPGPGPVRSETEGELPEGQEVVLLLNGLRLGRRIGNDVVAVLGAMVPPPAKGKPTPIAVLLVKNRHLPRHAARFRALCQPH